MGLSTGQSSVPAERSEREATCGEWRPTFRTQFHHRADISLASAETRGADTEFAHQRDPLGCCESWEPLAQGNNGNH